MRSRKTRINYAKDWEYTTNDTATLVTKYIGNKTDVVVPSKIEGKPVVLQNSVNNASGVFTNNRNIKSVKFGEGVGIANNSASNMFYNCTNFINAPTIPANVTNMSSTFYGCANLIKAPEIPENVTNMTQTFAYCYNLVDAPAIPAQVINMFSAFLGCRNLVDAPNMTNASNVTVLYQAFQGCYNLINAPVIPANVTSIGSMFTSCNSLVDAPVIPSNVTSLGFTFYGCTNLINAPVIPENVTEMTYAFSGCANLINAPVIPSNVKTIQYAFQNCVNIINSPVIPENITNMQCTFRNCTNLTGNIYIKSNRIKNTSMQNCFYGTTLPKNVYIPATGLDATNNTWNAAFNATYGINGKNGVTVYDIGDTVMGQWEYTTNATSALITKYIGTKTDVVVPYEIDGKNVVLQNSPNSSNGVFTNNKNITSVRFLTDGTKIANSNASNMFANCSNLKGVSIMPNGITNMSNAFLNCKNLSEAPYIPNSVTNVCNAFAVCYNLQGIVAIPPSVTNMAYAFKGSCPNIQLFIEPTTLNAATMNSAIYVGTEGSDAALKNGRPNIYVYNSTSNAPCSTYNYINYIVTDSMGTSPVGSKYFYANQIANMDDYSSNAFYYKPQDVIGGGITIRGVNDSYMRKIYVPCMITNESVNIIHNSGSYPPPFANTNIQSVIFGASVRWESDDATNAFRDCKSLTDVKGIPSNIKNMVNAFYSCTSLINSPILPNNITYMYQSFYGCTNLVNAPVIPDSHFISNMSDMFRGCVNLINGPIIFSQVSNLSNTFRDCISLINAPILSTIEMSTTMPNTFRNCTNLINVFTFPHSIATMNFTFCDCYNLINIPTIPRGTLAMCYTFQNCNNLNGAIIINSNRINNTSMQNCFYGTTLSKNVYIPSSGYSSKANTWNAAFNSTYGINNKNGVVVYDINTYKGSY